MTLDEAPFLLELTPELVTYLEIVELNCLGHDSEAQTKFRWQTKSLGAGGTVVI